MHEALGAMKSAVIITAGLILVPFYALVSCIKFIFSACTTRVGERCQTFVKVYKQRQYVKYEIPPSVPYFSATVDTSRRKVLVLDLDETLIHSNHDAGVMKTFQRSPYPPDFTFRVYIDRHYVGFNVYKRPHVDFFLGLISNW